MSLSDRWAELIYRIAISRSRRKIVLIPAGLTFWFGLGVLLVFASLWLDKSLPLWLTLPLLANLFISVPLLAIGVTFCLLTVYGFFKAKGSPVPLNPPQRLVTTGLYARVRNPMILGWVIMLFGIGVLLNSVSLLLIFAPLFALLNVLYLKTVEEKEMEKKFGQQYLEYRQSVPMFVPRFGKHDNGN